ncbi:sulfide/dihydroorotate dehydrogenase-like FAD/NAD-binding protein [candidate division WOR-3 bacterium]|nr:sulfide/dihydroorotate dehydrogenase-like FAD/NAD-binding protein [candidate division WOR-3 bacterium]
MIHKIIDKKDLCPGNYLIEVEASNVAQRFQPGQFVIIRIDEKGERIPLTVADFNTQKGTITLIFQVVGKSTKQLGILNVGDVVLDCVGPLGNPSEIKKFGRVICVGGGTGIACIYPLIRALADTGNEVISVIGARTASLLILENEITALGSRTCVATDDGSKGHHGFVTDVLMNLLDEYRNSGGVDRVIAIGPPVMMKAVADITKPRQIKTIVSLNSVMLDGTGMCGSCRVFIDGEMKLACIDGPEFDAHKVNFEDLISRLEMFKEKESEAINYYSSKAGVKK